MVDCGCEKEAVLKTVELTVIIVSYNTRDLTLNCVRSLYERTRGIELEVIVIDNASADGSACAIAEAYPMARLHASAENLGFAKANNIAASSAKGEYLLLLNPDTVILDGSIQRLLSFARTHSDAGIFGGRTLYPDGSLNPTSCWSAPTLWSTACRVLGLSHLFKGSRLFDPEGMGYWARDSVRDVDIVTGCFLLIKRSLWEQLRGFDEAFFMYGEEFDLCLRSRKLGKRCMVSPDATIIHYGSASEKVRGDKMVRLFRSKAQLFRKHWRPGAAWLGLAMLRFWSFSRMVASGLAWRDRLGTRQAWRILWERRDEWCAS
jgi:N-acetylglucosaminyl-diphospho-decaprenol L-rhamnosyltransferase